MAPFGQWTNNRSVYTQTGIPGQPLRPTQFRMGSIKMPSSNIFVDNNYFLGGGYTSGCGGYNPWGGSYNPWGGGCNSYGSNPFGMGCGCGGGGWMNNMPEWMQWTFGGLFGLGQVTQGVGALMAAIKGPEEQPGADMAEFSDLITLYGSDKKLSGCAKLDSGQYRCVYDGKVYTASSVEGLSDQIAEDINNGKKSDGEDDINAILKAADVQLGGYNVELKDGKYSYTLPSGVNTDKCPSNYNSGAWPDGISEELKKEVIFAANNPKAYHALHKDDSICPSTFKEGTFSFLIGNCTLEIKTN